MKSYKDQIVFITGGSSGLGLENACVLSAEGAHIINFDINPTGESLEKIRAARLDPSQKVVGYALDITDREKVLSLLNGAADDHGLPDLVLHYAGNATTGEFLSMAFEDFDRTMQICLYGSRHVCEALAPRMVERGRGTIALMASIAGFLSLYGYSDYCPAKAGVIALGEVLRIELKPLGVDVVLICPGEVDTPLVDRERDIIHPATWAIKKGAGSIPVGAAVRDIMKQLRQGKTLVIPGKTARLNFWLNKFLLPSWWNRMIDSKVAGALRSMHQK